MTDISQVPINNLVCPACRGPVVSSKQDGLFTCIGKDRDGLVSNREFYDQATPFRCVTDTCPADEFYMGTKTFIQIL